MPETPDEPTLAKAAKRWIRPCLLVVAAVFVGLSAWDLAQRWQPQELRIRWWLVGLSFVPTLVGSVLQGVAWRLLVVHMTGKPIAWGPSLRLYFESQLARYTPGKVGLPVVRMAGADELGIQASTIGASIGLEMLSWTATGSLVGFGLMSLTDIGWDLPGLGAATAVIIAGSFAAVGVLLVVDRRRFPARLHRMLHDDGQGPLLPIAMPSVQLLYWLTWSAHGLLLSIAVGGDALGSAATSFIFVLAPIAGFLALAAPAGLGVREGVLTWVLPGVLGAQGAVVAVTLSRTATLLVDVVLWLAARIVVRRE